MRYLLPNPYLLGLGIALLSYILIYGLKRLLSTRIGQFVNLSQNKWDDIVVHTVEQTTHFFMLGSSLYIAFQYIPHEKELSFYVDRAYFILTMLQVMIWGNHLLEKYITSAVNKRTRHNRAASSSVNLLKLLAKLVLFSVIFLFTLNNLNIKITTILAGLGVGGIAVALALQKILGDLFSSLSIVLDKPFVVGDFIIMDQYLGEVEKIGLRTTHIRSLTGEQIIFSNSDLLGARIRNMKRMHERRVSFVLSLTLQVDPDGIQKAVDIITHILTHRERVRFDRCHLMAISRTSFDLELVYFVLTDDYNIHMDIQQGILMDIYREFLVHQLPFAYPTQTLHHQMPPEYLKQNSHLDVGHKSLS